MLDSSLRVSALCFRSGECVYLPSRLGVEPPDVASLDFQWQDLLESTDELLQGPCTMAEH
jgi:hypothetical protein